VFKLSFRRQLAPSGLHAYLCLALLLMGLALLSRAEAEPTPQSELVTVVTGK